MLDDKRVQGLARKAGFDTWYQLVLGFRAKGYDCSESQAKRFWNGDTDPKLSSIERLCCVLGCRLDEIVTNGHTKPRPQKQVAKAAKKPTKAGSVSRRSRSR